MTAADSIREFVAPLLPGWRLQFGRWVDGNKAHRYAVLRNVGGLPIELVRRPQFTLTLVGSDADAPGDVATAADAVIEAMRSSAGDLVFMQPAEPVYTPTADGRPVYELAISAITN